MFQKRLKAIVQVLKGREQHLDAIVVPSSDPHQSEYVAERDKRRAWLSGFTGSAGTAVVMTEGPRALLWTDGRYWTQAATELPVNSCWKLMKDGDTGCPTVAEFLSKELSMGSTVGFDAWVTSVSTYRLLKQKCASRGIDVASLQGGNPIDEIWADQPNYPSKLIRVHLPEHAGIPWQDKVEALRRRLGKEGACAYVVCALDEVAWLFNLRGSDIAYNPVFFSFGLVMMDSIHLFIADDKLTDETRSHLRSVSIHDYADIVSFLMKVDIPEGKKVWIDPSMTNVALLEALGEQNVIERDSPLSLPKAIKNDAELEGMRQCHIRDAAAVVNFMAWLEDNVDESWEPDASGISEVDAADRLEWFRAQQDKFVGLSFTTISGAGPNGAIIHYAPERETARGITRHEIYLLDSGGQYLDGTTDITRTIHLGTPNAYEKECFTRVLIGHIELATAVFPVGTTGPSLDVYARNALWKVGLQYSHGTGHGVGAALNVHEGPQGISASVRRALMWETSLASGMIVSNEPGYYEAGAFGIRVESLMIMRPETGLKYAEKTKNEWIGFETITLVPIQASLIDRTIITEHHLSWINTYHRECLEKVGPRISGRALKWLEDACAPLE